MKRSVTLFFRKADLANGNKVKIVIGDTDYGDMKVGDGISIDLDEGSHEIKGIILGGVKFFKALTQFKIVDVEATTDDLIYSFEVKNKLSGWKAECILLQRCPMITVEKYVDQIMKLLTEAKVSGRGRDELVDLLDQTEYYLKRNRGIAGVYCAQLNEVAKVYMERHELEDAFETAARAELYAKLIIEDESSFFSPKLREAVEPEVERAKITQAYSLFLKRIMMVCWIKSKTIVINQV